MQNDKRALRLYLIIVFAASAAIETVWIYFGEAATQAGVSTILMLIPCITAIIISRIFYKKQNALGFNRCKPVYMLLSLLLPLLYLGLSYGLFWLFVKSSFTGSLAVLTEYAAAYSGQTLPDNMAVIISLIVMLPVTIVTALGEEVGWRGLMYPVMQRIWGWKKAVIASGVVWALWHLPIIAAGLYYPPSTNMFYLIPMFFIEVLAFGAILAWIRMTSKSVWPAIFCHALHNYLDQIVFQSLTKDGGSVYFVGEIGMITLFFTVIVAVFLLARRRSALAEGSAA